MESKAPRKVLVLGTWYLVHFKRMNQPDRKVLNGGYGVRDKG